MKRNENDKRKTWREITLGLNKGIRRRTKKMRWSRMEERKKDHEKQGKDEKTEIKRYSIEWIKKGRVSG